MSNVNHSILSKCCLFFDVAKGKNNVAIRENNVAQMLVKKSGIMEMWYSVIDRTDVFKKIRITVEVHATVAGRIEIMEGMKEQVQAIDTMSVEAGDKQAGMSLTINAVELFEKAEFAIGNAVKLMNGKYGGAFYANYLQDTGSKTGHLQLIIRYPDEQIKRVYLAKNTFLVAHLEDDGIGEVNLQDKVLVPKLCESLKVGDFRILEKYETPQMPIPAKVLWKIIMDNYVKIPVVPVYQTEDFQGMYWKLFDIAQSADIREGRENDVRFLVTKEELEAVAVENGLTLSELRTELNLRGLLVKDKPHLRDGKVVVNSYQLTKKVDGHNKRFYAIKKRIDRPVTSANETCLMEFTDELYETDLEKEVKQLKEINESLRSQVRSKENEIRNLYQNRIDDTTAEEVRQHCI